VQIMPDFRIGLLNGWLPLILYFAGLLLALAFFPRQARERLFEDPKYGMPAGVRLVRLLGQMAMFAWIGMMVFTPLMPGALVFLIGVLVYTAGYVTVMVALHHFKQTPANQVVVTGPYRLSRNPQWVGLALVLTGPALMTGVWLYLGIVLGMAIIYHQQILAEEKACLEQYGESYRAYMSRIPRYFWFL
jgi:protein-S-isoprenylcysteine O-methyltransferase Ste14